MITVVWCGETRPVVRVADGRGQPSRQGPQATRPAVDAGPARVKPVPFAPRTRPAGRPVLPRAARGESTRGGAAPLHHQRPAPQHR